MPASSTRQPCGRVRVYPNIPPLPADKFYAGVKKKRGPTRKPLVEVLRLPSKVVTNPYHSYTVSYKLRVLSYWAGAKMPCGPTKVREPTREEVAYRFKVPAGNQSRWKKEEAAGKFKDQKAGQRRAGGGGRGRLWVEMEKALFERFREQRAIGRPVRRGWFCKVSRELFQIHYPEKDSAVRHTGRLSLPLVNKDL